MPVEINWVEVGKAVAAVLTALGGLWAFAAKLQEGQNKRFDDQRTKDRDDRTARETADLARTRQTDENENAYVVRLEIRCRQLEEDNDRLRRERQEEGDRTLGQIRHDRDYWRGLAVRALGPLEESNALSEEAVARLGVTAPETAES